MLAGMDSSHDPHRTGSLIRHLRAVDSSFRAPESPPPHGAPAGLAGDDFTRRQHDLFAHLVEAVGSAEALWRLDVLPLPDEPFDWTAVEPCDVAFVTEVLALSDRGWSDLSTLGHPALLHSSTRARLVDQRDHLLDVAERRRTWSVVGTDGLSVRVDVRAQPTKVVHSTKAVLRDSGRAVVLVKLRRAPRRRRVHGTHRSRRPRPRP